MLSVILFSLLGLGDLESEQWSVRQAATRRAILVAPFIDPVGKLESDNRLKVAREYWSGSWYQISTTLPVWWDLEQAWEAGLPNFAFITPYRFPNMTEAQFTTIFHRWCKSRKLMPPATIDWFSMVSLWRVAHNIDDDTPFPMSWEGMPPR